MAKPARPRRTPAARTSEGEDYDALDGAGDSEDGDSQDGGHESTAGQRQELPAMDLGAGSNGDPFSDLADSAGAGLLGLEPADLDGGGAVEEEEPRPRELFDEWPRPARRTRTRTTALTIPKRRKSTRAHRS